MTSFENKINDFVVFVKEDIVKKYPEDWRFGQKIFNYIDQEYGIARDIQFEKHIDCFYNDNKVDDFLIEAAKILILKNKI